MLPQVNNQVMNTGRRNCSPGLIWTHLQQAGGPVSAMSWVAATVGKGKFLGTGGDKEGEGEVRGMGEIIQEASKEMSS